MKAKIKAYSQVQKDRAKREKENRKAKKANRYLLVIAVFLSLNFAWDMSDRVDDVKKWYNATVELITGERD
jgi:hypothetical protein